MLNQKMKRMIVYISFLMVFILSINVFAKTSQSNSKLNEGEVIKNENNEVISESVDEKIESNENEKPVKPEESEPKGDLSLKGFDLVNKDFSEIMLEKTGTTSIILRALEKDNKGNELIDTNLNLSLKENIEGISIKKIENNEFILNIDDVAPETVFTLILKSEDSNLSIERKVKTIINQDVIGVIDIVESNLVPGGSVKVKSILNLSSMGSADEAVLILTIYDGKRMVSIKEENIRPNSDNRVVETELSIPLPRNTNDVVIKAFLVEGRDATTATRNIVEPITINTKGED